LKPTSADIVMENTQSVKLHFRGKLQFLWRH